MTSSLSGFAFAFCALLSLAACSREMTGGEIEFSRQIFTRGIDFEEVTFSGWLSKESKRKKVLEQLSREDEIQTRFEDTSQLVASLPSLFGADAITIGNTVIFDNYLLDYSTSIFDSDRWLMAHELVHIWQWQNRDRLGFNFSKIVSEHLQYGEDVYNYVLEPGKRFSDYRFEQQGEIVECFAQLRQTKPGSPITLKHENLIRAEFPLDQLMQFLGTDYDNVVKVRSNQERDTCNG